MPSTLPAKRPFSYFGVRVKSLSGPGNRPSFAIGNEGRHDYSDWLGLIDEVRISSIARKASAMMFAPLAISVNPSPTNLIATVAGGNLILSWPADHIGWRLLMQTNQLAQGLSTNTNDWGTVSGSADTNQVIFELGPTMPAEFYRLVYP